VRRLYQSIYLTIIASLLVVVLVAAAVWRFGPEDSPPGQAVELAGDLVAALLPPANAPREVQQQAIQRLAERLDADLALFDSAQRPIAAAGHPLPPPSHWHGIEGGGWVHGLNLHLPDQRWLVVRPAALHQHPALHIILLLGGIALVVAVCAYPAVRGLTRRLERLQAGVETLGAGNLAARVKVEGRDEVARLAESFNRAAARIEALVSAHRMLLANASHDLRTPLSRIRMGIELYEQRQDPKQKDELRRDIAELDLLIDEILLASRLEAVGALQGTEEIDLLALAAEEAARYDQCSVEGKPVMVRGDAHLLRRLIRNLLENASCHGKPPIEVDVRPQGASAILVVADHGEGIAEAERERVFTPFHRLRTDTKGTGLGLSLVRQIARLHGGDAVAATSPKRPSCFRVSLPTSSRTANA
jgi:two-component system, OmpR family, sensor histidine kinase RstB